MLRHDSKKMANFLFRVENVGVAPNRQNEAIFNQLMYYYELGRLDWPLSVNSWDEYVREYRRTEAMHLTSSINYELKKLRG